MCIDDIVCAGGIVGECAGVKGGCGVLVAWMDGWV